MLEAASHRLLLEDMMGVPRGTRKLCILMRMNLGYIRMMWHLMYPSATLLKGMEIPVGKLALYTALEGVHPSVSRGLYMKKKRQKIKPSQFMEIARTREKLRRCQY